jgi:para-aminobenzoate synthetase component I
MAQYPELSPLAAAARLAGRRGRVVLHSARDDAGLGRCSFVAAEPSATLIARGHSLLVLDQDGRPAKRFTGDPLDAAEAFLAEHGCTLEPRAPGAPEPRVIGYLGYELARVIAQLPGGSAIGHDGPDLWLAAYGAIARWSEGGHEILGPDGDARDRLAEALARPARPSLAPSFGSFAPDDDDAHHRARIERVRDFLAAGDVHEVNIARRLIARLAAPGDPLALYAAFAEIAPALYGALIEAEGTTLISGSPERFLGSAGDRVEAQPLKGTCAQGDGAAAELAADPRVSAEHQLVVELAQHDLGLIAEPGSVSIDELGYILELPALCHKVSRISAKPLAGTGYAALLRATFPAGSITGAPKLRAMQLIDELEPVRRGAYCGAFGYFGPRGAFDLAIAIQTGVLTRNELRVHVGGGIVADSDTADELHEIELKAAGWIAALDRLRAQSHESHGS